MKRRRFAPNLSLSLALTVLLSGGCGAQRQQQLDEDEYYVSPDQASRPTSGSRPETPPAQATESETSAPPVLIRRAPTSSGDLDGDDAGAVIFANASGLDRCYEEAGGVAAGRGVVYVLLDVEPSGAIDGVLVGHSDVSGARFVECLAGALEALTMPTSSGHAVIQTHLVFGADDEAQGRALLRAYRASRATDEAQERLPLTAIRDAVQGCYERVFRGRGSEVGRLVLGLTLHEDGRVASVEITEDNLDGRLDGCVLITVEKLRLDPEEGSGPSLVYPVILAPGQADPASPTGESAAR